MPAPETLTEEFAGYAAQLHGLRSSLTAGANAESPQVQALVATIDSTLTQLTNPAALDASFKAVADLADTVQDIVREGTQLTLGA